MARICAPGAGLQDVWGVGDAAFFGQVIVAADFEMLHAKMHMAQFFAVGRIDEAHSDGGVHGSLLSLADF